MGLGIPPLIIKIMFESDPLKPTMLVGKLGVSNKRPEQEELLRTYERDMNIILMIIMMIMILTIIMILMIIMIIMIVIMINIILLITLILLIIILILLIIILILLFI